MTDLDDALSAFLDNDSDEWNPSQGSSRFYELARQFRDNEVGEVFSQGRQVAEVLTKQGEYFTFPLCSRGISKRVARRSVQSISVPNQDDLSTTLTSWLDEVKFNTRFKEAIFDCATYGRMFGFIWPRDVPVAGEDGQEVVAEDGTPETRTTYDLTFLTPLTTKAFYDRNGDIRKVIRVWDDQLDGKPIIRVDEYLGSLVNHLYTQVDTNKDPKASDLEPWYMEDGDEESSVTEHDMGRIPFFEFSLPGKLPAHWYAWGVQNAYTKVINLIIAACDFIVFPMRYLTQTVADPTSPRAIQERIKDLGLAEDTHAPNLTKLQRYLEDFEDESGTDAGEMVVDPSAINQLRPGEDLRQLVQGSISEMMELKDKLESLAAQVMTIPSYMLTGQAPSGIAISELSADFYTMVQDDNTRDGTVLVDIFQFVMGLLDSPLGTTLPVVAWNSVKTPADLTVAEMTALIPPYRIIMEKMGIPEEQAKKLAQEMEDDKVQFAKRIAEAEATAAPAPAGGA